MANYLMDSRYTKELTYVTERNIDGRKEVTLKDNDGILYRWDTCLNSKAYQSMKEVLGGLCDFTYRGEMLGMEVVSHLRLKR